MDLAHTENLQIVLILTAGFISASLFGYISQKLKLSLLLGYLIAGYLIGPYSPGFVVDMKLSEQLAEIGVILMMFGVGLHFRWEDLVGVKKIAVPGALLQSLIAMIFGTVFVYGLGWSLISGVILGFAISVASTVVLVRVLTDNNRIDTPEGHIAVGWLIVEDIFTVLVLLLIPIFVDFSRGASSVLEIALLLGWTLLKFVLLACLMFTLGGKLVKYALFAIARTRSHELFTISILALTFLIAVGSSLLFGTSIALGAFIAGMVIGQTDVRHQASANALPLKDVFVVIFFLSVGVLFNPAVFFNEFTLFLGVLAIILLVKPLTALLILLLFRYNLKKSLTVSLALAQIGEFSFILAEEAFKFDIFPDEGFDVIVACALVSIALNPLLFKGIDPFMRWIERKDPTAAKDLNEDSLIPSALVIGFGPIGQMVTDALTDLGFIPTVIERNVDTVSELRAQGKQAIYGDATSQEILTTGKIVESSLLVITFPDTTLAVQVIRAARNLNPDIKILTRVQYIIDKAFFEDLNVAYICCEEESMGAFNKALQEIIENEIRWRRRSVI